MEIATWLESDEANADSVNVAHAVHDVDAVVFVAVLVDVREWVRSNWPRHSSRDLLPFYLMHICFFRCWRH